MHKKLISLCLICSLLGSSATVFAATNSNYTVNESSITATTVTKSTTATQNEAIETQMKINEAIVNKALANKGNAKDIFDNVSVRNKRSIPSAAAKKSVKAAAKWLKANKAKVIKAIPSPLRRYVTFDALTKAIDAYTNYSDSINSLLTKVFDKMLPEWADVAIPGIVAVIELILPF